MEDSLKEEIFKDLYTILEAASSKCNVIDEKFPGEFFESEPTRIYSSYVEFLRGRADADGQIDEQQLALTNIRQRFEEGEYARSKDGLYRLYHDVRLVSTMLIQYYSPGTRSYQMVDKFYKFATELLLRECYKHGAMLVHAEPYVKSKEETEFFNIISKDFIKISTSYTLPIVESYHISTKFGDLFSSTISSSPLDERPPDLPNSNFEVTKIIPHTGLHLSNKLGFVAANTSNIPDPTLPPTEMMTKFLHPNWYALPTTLWLKYGGYESFAPTITENGSVVDSSRIGDIWLERTSYHELWKLRKGVRDGESNAMREEENGGKVGEPEATIEEVHDKVEEADTTREEDNSVDKEKDESAGKEQEDKIDDSENIPEVPVTSTLSAALINGGTAQQHKNDAVSAVEPSEQQKTNTYTPKSVNVNLEHLYRWAPSNEIDDDELEAFRNNTHQQLISKCLLQLQQMKRSRIQAGKVSKPTSEETKIYFKIQRMLKEVILAQQAAEFPKIYIKEFPVLQANYAGNIPVVRTYPNRKKKYKK
ncbi:FAFR223Wp [Eremothecium gossypii FDAG1]|nr:FAFR223Wp [Eremothecium gossypii FDAG1]